MPPAGPVGRGVPAPAADASTPPEFLQLQSWGRGVKDNVIADPGQVTRLGIEFDTPGRYVWHCHIVECGPAESVRRNRPTGIAAAVERDERHPVRVIVNA